MLGDERLADLLKDFARLSEAASPNFTAHLITETHTWTRECDGNSASKAAFSALDGARKCNDNPTHNELLPCRMQNKSNFLQQLLRVMDSIFAYSYC